MDDLHPVERGRNENLKYSSRCIYQAHSTVNDPGIRMTQEPLNAVLKSVIVEPFICRNEADDIALRMRQAPIISLPDPAIGFRGNINPRQAGERSQVFDRA